MRVGDGKKNFCRVFKSSVFYFYSYVGIYLKGGRETQVFKKYICSFYKAKTNII
jgi:hypothetical protein